MVPSTSSTISMPARARDAGTPKVLHPPKETVRLTKPGNHDALYQVRLLSALRSGDPAQIHPFLADIGKERRSSEHGEVDLGAAALHLAIRCASCDTVALLLGHRSISPNAVHPPGSGTTALHLAASLPRLDVVSLLLEQEDIDDTLRDAQGRTCLDVAKGKEVSRAIKDSRALLEASYHSVLHHYVMSPSSEKPPDALIAMLSCPRIRHVDLSYLDESTGTTLLHEAAKRRDLRLVELAVRAGADVFARDRRGRGVGEHLPKDDRVRVFLRQFTNQDTTLLDQSSTEPVELKGYLNKYTNVAKGYNTRWFVLKQGVLSYYRHQEDEQVASRGSISMKTAGLKQTPSSSGLRFEVHSTPTRGHHGVQKWYLKANHPVEASRWIQALTKSIEWSRREAERVSTESEVSSLLAPSMRMSTSTLHRPSHRHTLESTPSSIGGDEPPVSEASPTLKELSGDDHDHYGDKTENSSSDESQANAPHHVNFELHGNSTVAQMDLTAQMLSALHVDAGAADAKAAMADSLHTVQTMLSEYVQMVREREDWYREQLAKERERQNVWEESLQAVVKEGEFLERELRNKARRRSRLTEGSGFITASEMSSAMSTLRNRPSALALSPPPALDIETPQATAIPIARAPSEPLAETPTPTTSALVMRRTSLGRRPMMASPTGLSPTGSRPRSMNLGTTSPTAEEDEVDTDEEDEFFDAIEANNLPNLVITDQLAGRRTVPLPPLIDREQYKGYEHLRTHLAISSDDRPPMSLWAVLKNSIGKDLTRISFPVFFNEPTSMLQRMAEDMEFSECLDAAAAEKDPHRRIAFVAAFAMSNYSSTIGRIAKPFNPMLSETFEYVRLDKKYRYVSEQVSHHPPISACWAESPAWRYYGEVDAQNKFMGKSFEIRPTGVAHADLLLPEDWAPQYPKAKDSVLEGRVVEHYSWKKVTTNISGFILGSPTIDHYGDMVITNHRTGDQCVLTFKPRGWRGKDAFEISGYVADKEGNVTYDIAGRWNSQLVARAVGTGVGHLHPDVSCASMPEYILLWRNSEKPPAPFNLTPFAITLNDCPDDTLRPYVCPTDCRMRPDQRAFELGKYERANELKQKQEEFQRAVRKAREEGRAPPHRPRWFSATTEPDTGERVWAPARVDNKLEYWIERERIYKEKTSGHEEKWKAVDRIFIEDRP
ncbi:oxysterol-binding protein-domain-containing protein [Phanerochaete sordida]|uniref:Oxysterol-binding protein-domain-containing protein n=1 Tax=Phanerochaete sordida TaxID=48140 RepID=A0A9P3LC77_9APHY|nr:oxysterol-binding protein-domain-containing protein [Phanerochaete sordida]